MQIPNWLANLEMEMALALEPCAPYRLTIAGTVAHTHTSHGPDYWLALALLESYSPAFNRWLDAHVITGSVENRRIAGRIARQWSALRLHFLALDVETHPGLTHTCASAKRLAGLFPSLRLAA